MNIELLTLENQNFKVDISYFKQSNPKGIIVVFPGAGYSVMGPCLYYPSTALLENGYELLNIEYDFRRSGPPNFKDYLDFIANKLENLNLPTYKVALCKSLGNRIVSSRPIDLFDKVIWLTPQLNEDLLIAEIIRRKTNSFVIIGTKDPAYSDRSIDKIKDNKIPCLIIQDADHGLDIDTNLNHSLDEMKQIISSTLDFVEK